MGEVGFQLVADTGEVGVNRVGLDVAAHEDNIATEGVLSQVNGAIVEFTEQYVGV
jgi:hypothetical protein